MGLFDSKNSTGGTAVLPAVAECDNQLAVLARKKEELIYQIGKLYVDNNDFSSAAGTIYEAFMQELKKNAEDVVSLEKRKLAVQNLRKCEKCGNILVLDSIFCNKCGEKLEELFAATEQNPNICTKCGAPYEENALFCTCCGNKLS